MNEQCPVCKIGFETNKNGDKKFCSTRCRMKYHNRIKIGMAIDVVTEEERLKDSLPEVGSTVECLTCHTEFIKKRYWQQYCCYKCVDNARRRRNKGLPPDARSRYQKSPEERFWEKVNKNGPLPNHCPEIGNCWIWIAAKNSQGYGHFTESRKNRKLVNSGGAHCYSYKINVGPIPSGMEVCHKCDNPSCVRPDHLWIDTRKNNQIDYHNKVKEMRSAIRPYDIEDNKNLHLLTPEKAIICAQNLIQSLQNLSQELARRSSENQL